MGRESYTCEHCGAEADLILKGMDSVEDVLQREKPIICKACGKEIVMQGSSKETYACLHCGAEADMTLEGFEGVEEVLKREKHLTCKACGQEVAWTAKEDVKAVKVAMEAEKNAIVLYSELSKVSKDKDQKKILDDITKEERSHIVMVGNVRADYDPAYGAWRFGRFL